jgi:hypothetical protein
MEIISGFAEKQRKTKKTLVRCYVAGPSACVLTTGQQFNKQKNVVTLLDFPNLHATGLKFV